MKKRSKRLSEEHVTWKQHGHGYWEDQEKLYKQVMKSTSILVSQRVEKIWVVFQVRLTQHDLREVAIVDIPVASTEPPTVHMGEELVVRPKGAL